MMKSYVDLESSGVIIINVFHGILSLYIKIVLPNLLTAKISSVAIAMKTLKK